MRGQSKEQISLQSVNFTELTKSVNSVGNIHGNYIGKFRLMLKASRFAPDDKEVPFLLKHIVQVYLIFIIQLCYTGMVSWYMYSHPALLIKIMKFFLSAHGLFMIAGYIGLVILLFFAQIVNSLPLGIIAIIGITTVIGIPLGIIPIVYNSDIILEALILTGSIYIGSAMFGILTKNNLTGWGTPLFGGLLALIILGFFQYHFHNSFLNFTILVADILIFTLYTAYDNQMMKIRFLDKLRDDIPDTGKSWLLLAISSSLDIYLDFVNLFLDILSLLGDDDD